MSSTGNVFPGTAANVDRAGNTAWTNPGNSTADDAANATVVVPSDYLVTSNYNFSAIPNNVAIRGITLRVEASESGTGSSNYVAQLHTNTTPTLVGNAIGAVTVNGTTPVISTSGGVADLWGTTLTASQVKNSGFGVSVWSTDTINTLSVDFVTLDIEWTDVPNAWDAQQYFRKRRNLTHRRRLDALLNDANPGTPSNSADRTLDEPFRTVRLRSRRALSIGWMAALTAQPQAPAGQPVSAWLAAPQPRRRLEVQRRLVAVEPLHWQYIAPSPIAALSPEPKAFRIERRYVLRRVEPLEFFPPPTGPPTAQGYPAWALPEAFYRSSWRRRLRVVPEHETYPATPAPEVSDDRALEAPFVTRTIRSRRLQRGPSGLESVAPAAPGVSQAPLPAWAPKLAHYRPSHRTHRAVPELNRFPATPVQQGQPITAVTANKAKRRKHRQGLFLSGGGIVEARVQPQFPSYATRSAKKRASLKRRLLRAPGLPSAPATPAVPAQPVSAWAAPKQHWILRERTLQKAAPQITHPQTPAVAPQPESAWRLKTANRSEQHRKLLPQAPQITYPRTLVSDVATLLVRAFKRRDTKRTLRGAAHAPLYQQIPQPLTAWKLAEAFRRHGWRELRPAPIHNVYPQSPISLVGYLVGEAMVRVALDGAPTTAVALDAEPNLDTALDGEPQVRPQ